MGACVRRHNATAQWDNGQSKPAFAWKSSSVFWIVNIDVTQCDNGRKQLNIKCILLYRRTMAEGAAGEQN